MKLDPANFAAFFHGIHGYKPFPWQQNLVNSLAQNDEWPDVLDLPTGTGKTAVLDVAVFHLALRGETPKSAALRIALIVDRRLVVDNAFDRAKKIADILANPHQASKEGISVVEEVSRRLKPFAYDEKSPLVAQRLRGGAPLEDDWARTPTQPTILCSTVDQVGSRLLFRGYGVSNRMKPVHAGLIGENSLIFLDEVHLSEPFRQTLTAIQKIGKAGIKVVSLSATPSIHSKRSLKLTREDHTHSVLKQRLEVAKPARIHKPCKDNKIFARLLARTAVDIAGRLRKEDGVSAPAVAVIVNRVHLARETFKELRKCKTEAEALLMIGRSRSAVRDQIVREKLAPFLTGASDRSNVSPLFIVATQCLEVGVDVDLDGLVSQVASLDALRQRFGRLNRNGRKIHAEGAIMTLKEDVEKNAEDPIYGDRLRLTWQELAKIAKDDVVDFGIESLETVLRGKSINLPDLLAPQTQAPVLMPAYLDLWSQTCPIPNADPEVGLFLHGMGHMSSDVSLVWRSDLSEKDMSEEKDDTLKTLIQLVPPRAAEMISIPLWAVRKWLTEKQTGPTLYPTIADVPAKTMDEEGPDAPVREQRRGFRWAGADDQRTGLVSPSDLRPGDVLLVPAEYGGCDNFGWAPESNRPVEDVADMAAQPFRGKRHAVRIARDVVHSSAQWQRVLAVLAGSDGSVEPELIERLLDALPTDAEMKSTSEENSDDLPMRPIREPIEALRRAKGRLQIYYPYAKGSSSEGGAVIVARKGLKEEIADIASIPVTEDDRLSNVASVGISIDRHTEDVIDWVKSFVKNLKLPQNIAEDLALAAFFHDAGKADPRFQMLLHGSDAWNQPDGPPIAKSAIGGHGADARKLAGLPKGWRHEALSVRMALTHPRFAEAHDPALVLWLIGTHHGVGRPFFNFVEMQPEANLPACLGIKTWRLALGSGPQSTAFNYQGEDWPKLFEQLKRKYGVWGLAHLESVLRLADHRASEKEELS